ncbi:MAG: F0F1 ATP synthase subunit B [bacterium]
MLIDWFTVVAQIFNFLVLVWLMRRFLYQPILHAIDAREERIAKELADADAKMAEAKKERAEFQRKNEEFEQQRVAQMNTATDAAKAEGQRLLDGVRKDADDLMAKRQQDLRTQEQNLRRAISLRTQQEVFAITRKTLTALAGASLEERMVDAFIRQLRDLGAPEKENLTAILAASPDAVIIRTTFELPAAQCNTIEAAIAEIFTVKIHAEYKTTPELISGIELTANGQKVAWSIADYLLSLEKSVGELLHEKDEQGAVADGT